MTAAPRRTTLRGFVAGAFRRRPAGWLAALLERIAATPPNALAVLTYHRVDEPGSRPWLNPSLLSATPGAFEAQMSAVLRRHRPVGLPEVLAARRGERDLPGRAVLVTFDDGYRDFLENAWPILGRLGIPATLFVPTAYPDAPGSEFWWDQVWDAVRGAKAGTFETPAGRLELSDDGSRRAAARALVDHHKRLPHDEAMESVAAVTDRLRPRGQPVPDAPALDGNRPRRGRTGSDGDVLGWEEIRRLAVAGLHVAPHTRTHALMTRLEPGRVAHELLGARRDLERQLGELSFGTVFAYPSGAHSPATREALASAGFELAFTTERGINHVGASDPLAFRRINVGMRAGAELLRAQLAFFTLRYRRPGV